MKILIVVDNSRRDLYPSKLLHKAFLQKGIDAYICNRLTNKLMVRKLQPDACVLPRGDWPITREIGQCCRVYVVPSEGGRLTPETMLSVFCGRTYRKEDVKVRLDQNNNPIKKFDYIRKIYLWGSQTKKFLTETKLFNPEQLFVAGNGRLDIYRKKKKNKFGDAKKKLTIGFAFSAKATSVYNGKIEYAKFMYNLDYRSHLPLVPQGRFWEDYAWRDFAILRRMMLIVKTLIETTDHDIYLRVGPLESINDYNFLEKLHPHRVKIQRRDGQLFDFLKDIDVLMTCWSTTGLEALLMDIPVISIPLTIDYDFLVSHVEPKANGFDTFLSCYHTPRSEKEVFELISEVKKGNLPVTPNQEKLDSVLREIYNWPSEKSATMTIVDDILADMQGYTPEPCTVFKKNLPFSRPVEILLSPEFSKKQLYSALVGAKGLVEFYRAVTSGNYATLRQTDAIKNAQVDLLTENTSID